MDIKKYRKITGDVIYLYTLNQINDNCKKKLWYEECWDNDCHKTQSNVLLTC